MFDAKVHDGFDVARATDRAKFVRTRRRFRARWLDHNAADDDFSLGALELQKPTVQRDIEDRFIWRRIEEALRSGPAPAPEPCQKTKQVNLARGDFPNRTQRRVGRCEHANLVDLTELPHRGEIVDERHTANLYDIDGDGDRESSASARVTPSS